MNTNHNNNAAAGRRQSIASSIITIPQPPSNPRDRASKGVPTGISCAPQSDPETETSPEDDVDDLRKELDALNCKGDTSASTSASDADADTEKVRDASLSQLEGKTTSPVASASALNVATSQAQTTLSVPTDPIARVKKKKSADAEAKIVLKEEKAAIFHDFLKCVYPQ